MNRKSSLVYSSVLDPSLILSPDNDRLDYESSTAQPSLPCIKHRTHCPRTTMN